MCGRFAAFTPPQTFAELFDATNLVQIDSRPRYNIAPGQNILAARNSTSGERILTTMQWGLIPFWAKEKKTGYSMINARAETVAEKPAFKRAYRQRRCLIAADGFYEWKKEGSEKQPYFFHMKDKSPLAFAGLWEHWEGGGESLDSCAIIVTTANKVLAPVHDRMPVIIPPDAYDLWLNPDVEEPERLSSLLVPFAPEQMEGFAVDKRVNVPSIDTRELIR
jgi:putative SOS response-associated peptidase YedK